MKARTLPAIARPPDPDTDTVEFLDTVRRVASSCTKCSLHNLRTNCVFGTGHAAADLMFVGEAPGADEDRSGTPFSGKSGALLEKIIEAMGTDREAVWLTNVVVCRLDDVRHLNKTQIKACRSYLENQIEAVDPRIIVALGSTAWVWFHGNDKRKMADIRGTVYRWRNRLVVPTYHPAFLLRKPEYKGDVWTDMQKVHDLLGRGDADLMNQPGIEPIDGTGQAGQTHQNLGLFG